MPTGAYCTGGGSLRRLPGETSNHFPRLHAIHYQPPVAAIVRIR